ncbi:MAG: hypothetical protein Kapaf2KO_00860 [Candidatus Kapaibacteriales bacterium]
MILRSAIFCLFLSLLFTSCSEPDLGPGEIIERPASSEAFHSRYPDSAFAIGGVIAIDLEGKGQALPDSVYDSFPDEQGIDIVQVNVNKSSTYHFRLQEGLDVDLELIDPFNSTVFRLSPQNRSNSSVLQEGKYGIKIYNNVAHVDSSSRARKLLFLKPDTELMASDPIGILAGRSEFLLETDLYMILGSDGCESCNLEQARMSGFVFHQYDEERTNLNDVLLRGANMDSVSLRYADISGNYANFSSFRGANLRFSSINGFIDLSHSNFSRADLNSVILSGLSGRFLDFDLCDLRRSSATELNFRDASFVDCNLLLSEFSNNIFEFADFTYAKFGGSSFIETNLTNSLLIESDMVGADISNNDFTGCDMSEANLSNANVTGSNFCNLKAFRNMKASLAVGIGEADCLPEIVQKLIDAGGEPE